MKLICVLSSLFLNGRPNAGWIDHMESWTKSGIKNKYEIMLYIPAVAVFLLEHWSVTKTCFLDLPTITSIHFAGLLACMSSLFMTLFIGIAKKLFYSQLLEYFRYMQRYTAGLRSSIQTHHLFLSYKKQLKALVSQFIVKSIYLHEYFSIN